jgi:hypothetical protein
MRLVVVQVVAWVVVWVAVQVGAQVAAQAAAQVAEVSAAVGWRLLSPASPKNRRMLWAILIWAVIHGRRRYHWSVFLIWMNVSSHGQLLIWFLWVFAWLWSNYMSYSLIASMVRLGT